MQANIESADTAPDPIVLAGKLRRMLEEMFRRTANQHVRARQLVARAQVNRDIAGHLKAWHRGGQEDRRR